MQYVLDEMNFLMIRKQTTDGMQIQRCKAKHMQAEAGNVRDEDELV